MRVLKILQTTSLFTVSLLGLALCLAPLAQAKAKIKDRLSPLNQCDELAASPEDMQRPEGIAGVPAGAVDFNVALLPCEAAVAQEPNNLRMLAQLARVYARNNEPESQKREFELNLKAAEGGYVLGMLNLGNNYDLGIGTPVDGKAAFKWFSAAASPPNNHRKALHDVGVMYRDGIGTQQDIVQAGEYFCKSAEAGFVPAFAPCGNRYRYGDGVREDKVAALSWYERGALEDDAVAQADLAESYYAGSVSAVNETRAFEWASRAASAGNAKGRLLLGDLYDEGRVVAKDRVRALGLYLLAAEQGNSNAQARMADAYYVGNVISRDDAQSLRWAQLSADKGNAIGKLNLGLLYDEGRGVEKDDAKAAALYKESADLGDKTGMNNYGEMLFYGEGVPKNVEAALNWLQRAKQSGSSYAPQNIASHYELEEGGLIYDASTVADNLLSALRLNHAPTRKILIETSGKSLKPSTLNKLQDILEAEGKNFVRADGKLTESAIAVLSSYTPK